VRTLKVNATPNTDTNKHAPPPAKPPMAGRHHPPRAPKDGGDGSGDDQTSSHAAHSIRDCCLSSQTRRTFKVFIPSRPPFQKTCRGSIPPRLRNSDPVLQLVVVTHTKQVTSARVCSQGASSQQPSDQRRARCCKCCCTQLSCNRLGEDDQVFWE